MPIKKYLSVIFQLGRDNSRLLVLMFFFGLLPLVVSSLVVLGLQSNPWIFGIDIRLLYIFATFGAVFLIGAAFSPSTLIAILCGYYLGWMGLIPIFVSYPLAALLGLYLGKLVNRVFKTVPFEEVDSLKPYLGNIEKNQTLMVASLRLSPVLPFAMINIFLAKFSLNLWKYTYASMLGMLPRTMLFFWGGKNAREVWNFVNNPEFDGFLNLLPFILVIVALLGLIIVLKKVVSVD
ncbi:MAG: hypothetical protein EA362_07290 [Saprospirales bacterium]|nr:MAG: hypothetical protein EA362_07290 [Saprospirales bacterium]